jgi:hypothetical protein
MRILVIAITLTLIFGVVQAQGPLPVPAEPGEGTMAVSQVQKLAPPDAGAFGYSMDTNGSTEGAILVVGAPNTTVDVVSHSGAVFIYRMDANGQWQFWQRINAPELRPMAFGYAVSVGGSGENARIAVNAPNGYYDAPVNKRVFVYRPIGDTWSLEAVLHNSEPATTSGGNFGEEISFSDDGMILAIRGHETGNSTSYNAALVHIYERSGSTWSGTSLIRAPDFIAEFGKRIEIVGSGNNALMAVTGSDSGLYLYHRPDGVWLLQQMLDPDNDGWGDDFAISGRPGKRIIAIGGSSWNGAVYIYRHNGSEWVNSDTLYSSQFLISTPYFQGFGGRVGLSGNANNATLYATIYSGSPNYWDLLLRIHVTPTSATLMQEIASPTPLDRKFVTDLMVSQSANGDAVFTNMPGHGTGTVYIFGNKIEVNVSPKVITVIEGGPGTSYALSLSSPPNADVMITADPDDGCELGMGTGQPITVMFTPENWNTPQTLVVQAPPDSIAEAPSSCTVTHSVVSEDTIYNGIIVSPVSVIVVDPPIGAPAILPYGHQSVATTEGGVNDSYMLILSSEPSGQVDLTITPDAQCDLGAGAGQAVTFMFSVEAWQMPALVTVNAADDALNEGTHTCTIGHSVSGPVEYAGMAVPGVTVTITDNDAANLITNGDFETAANAPWVIKNKTGDKVLCDTVTPSRAYAGSCAFKFKGGVIENASLTQNVDLTGVVFGPSDAVRLQAMVRGGALAKGKLRVRVVYAGGEDTVIKLALPATGAYALAESAWLLLESPDVQAITVTILHKSAIGSVWIDNVAMWHRPVIVLRGVPAAAVDVDGFRAP